MCPDENTISGYLQGILPASEVHAVETHVDGCGSCREMMSELGRVVGALDDRGFAYRDTVQDEAGPQLVGRYAIQSIIGRGGMGEVLLATDPVLNRSVAIKVMHQDALSPEQLEEAKERLVREARAMATLAHPNVVGIYDAGQHDGSLFLAMEYVEGTTLAQWLANEAGDWRDVVQRFVEAGRGLAAAHAAGILHRDFKPQNVLIGRDGRVKVTDFGLARTAAAPVSMRSGGGAGHAAQLTVVGAVVGTPAYMAPEQLEGAVVDARADVFSFCVSLHEALFGVRPYDAPNLQDLRWQMMQGRIQPVPDTRGVPRALIRVLHRGLRIDPGARHASMHELLEAIEHAGGGEGHVRFHVWCQLLFAPCHAAFASWITYDAFIKPGGSPPSTPTTTSSGGAMLGITAFVILVVGATALFFVYAGTFWAALNAYGLAKRQRWARTSTLLYGVAALSSCIGIPYGVYTIWSLTREASKNTLQG